MRSILERLRRIWDRQIAKAKRRGDFICPGSRFVTARSSRRRSSSSAPLFHEMAHARDKISPHLKRSSPPPPPLPLPPSLPLFPTLSVQSDRHFARCNADQRAEPRNYLQRHRQRRLPRQRRGFLRRPRRRRPRYLSRCCPMREEERTPARLSARALLRSPSKASRAVLWTPLRFRAKVA